jgi:hypothetical protein
VGEGHSSKSRKGAASTRRGRPPVASTSDAAPGGFRANLTKADGVVGDLHRLYFKLDEATERLTGELVDKQIKIARILLERMGHEDLLARIEKLEVSNRELEAKLAGGASGNPVVRADAAPAFVLPTGESTH